MANNKNNRRNNNDEYSRRYTGKLTSQIIQTDELTDRSYNNPEINFDPRTSDDTINYTSYRVAKNVYNTYEKDSNKPEIFGYFSDWCQYDGRMNGANPETSNPADWANGFGRGRDLANMHALAYDRLIFGFIGIVGDQGEKAGIVQAAAEQLEKTEDEVTFIDPWGDIAAWQNNNFMQEEWSAAGGYHIGQRPENDPEYIPYKDVMNEKAIKEGRAFGILGGLYKKQREAESLGGKLELGLSLGGWTLSGPFYNLTQTPSRRMRFIDSICKIFDAFPTMFNYVDVDWEYPGTEGHHLNPPVDQVNDGKNYALLMDEMRKTFDSRYTGVNKKHISIACAAPVEKMQYSNIPELIQKGLDGINIMSYDFFGTPWAEELGHQANLHDNGSATGWCTEAAVEYLLAQGVDPKYINVGWGAYSRNGQNANITSHSPLKGSYSPKGGVCLGSMETGTCEWYDIIYNYVDLENARGKNGYNLYTDAIANADYLHNPSNGMFMSFETPRATYVKGKYVAEKSLGGLFVWTADIDNGLLANAAREGCGYHAQQQVIDMSQFYFCGSNISSEECQVITGGGGNPPSNRPPIVTITPASVEMKEGEEVTLNATVTDPDGDSVSSGWISVPAGLTIVNQTYTSLTVFAEDVSQDTEYVIVFEATDGQSIVKKNVSVKVLNESSSGGDCTDPDAVNYPAWNPNQGYAGGSMVSHQSLVWQASYWADEGQEPGDSDPWILKSNIVANWSSHSSYNTGSIVNHASRMWESTGWMDAGVEPGAAGQEDWAKWNDIGGASCTPPSRDGRKVSGGSGSQSGHLMGKSARSSA